MQIVGRRQGRMITMRELAQNTSHVMNSLIEDGERACVTRYGRPVAVIVPIDAEQIESHLLTAVLDTVEPDEELSPLDVGSSRELAVEADVDLNEAERLASAGDES
ncbi:MAG: type II toxin-antitoxin system prevent-host-death family antitoxin [Acidimicrobiia bacterium]|nr:type II toxin-antitoxin system prevent-host-death family antitoxin [Acidimicrobiia bacterium]